MGGLHRASQKWAMTNVVACFLPFFLPQPTTHIQYTHTASTITSLTSKCELEVVFFFGFNVSITTATSLASKHKSGVIFLSASMHLLQPPPPSHPNASRRWFQCLCHIYHLQLTSKRELEGFFQCFSTFTTTTSSLEVEFLVVLT